MGRSSPLLRTLGAICFYATYRETDALALGNRSEFGMVQGPNMRLDRRVFGFGLGSIMLMASMARAASAGRVGQHAMGAEMQACIDLCHKCHVMCLSMIDHCLKMAGPHAAPNHIRLMLDCAQICATAADFMARGSGYHAKICRECAEICDACALSCKGLAGMEACMAVCQDCAKSCREMANMG